MTVSRRSPLHATVDERFVGLRAAVYSRLEGLHICYDVHAALSMQSRVNGLFAAQCQCVFVPMTVEFATRRASGSALPLLSFNTAPGKTTSGHVQSSANGSLL